MSLTRFLIQVVSHYLWCTSRLGPHSSDRSCFFYTPQTLPDWWMGVPQGLVLRPSLFLLHGRLLRQTSLTGGCTQPSSPSVPGRIQRIQQVFRMPFLPVSTTYLCGWEATACSLTTEVMWCASSRRMHQVPAILLSTVTAESTVHSFRRALKTHLFTTSFPPSQLHYLHSEVT